jgi:phosphoglucosamine mutase
MSNRGLHRALREKDVSVLEVGVGDRLVVEAMRREGLQLGGEQSGHIVFGADNHYIGDGLYTALRVIQVLIETGRSLADLAAPYQAFPQVLLNVPVCSKPELAQVAGVPQLLRLAADELGADGRILLRYSGTEPLARVMVEGPNEKRIQELARAIADRIAATIGG